MQTTYEDLKDKIILVTGSSRGIGREIVLSLSKQKALLAINFRRGKEDHALKLVKECEENGAKAIPVYFDITNFEDIKENLNQFTKEYGPIGGLVNNAGISKDNLILRLKEEEISHILDVNLKGSIFVTTALSRNFLKATNVSIVNISSVVGLMGNSAQSVYAASKAGLIGFTKSLAKELASRNVRCNAICPGFIDTQMTDTLNDKVKESYLAAIPLKRFGAPADVANLTCFLLSRASDYITGEIIKVDGGIYI